MWKFRELTLVEQVGSAWCEQMFIKAQELTSWWRVHRILLSSAGLGDVIHRCEHSTVGAGRKQPFLPRKDNVPVGL